MHQLPHAGGLLDQPGTDVLRMEQVLNAKSVVQEERDKRETGRADAEKRLKARVGS